MCLCLPVSRAHRCLIVLLMPVRGRFSVNTLTVVDEGRDVSTVGAMVVERRRFALMKEKLADLQ